jgi:hypothetical protein
MGRPDFLYHGTSRDRFASILSEGVNAPSYWGTLEEALDYASDGMIFQVPVDAFDPDGLSFNHLLAASMAEAEDGQDIPMDGSWEDSLREFGSVRYDLDLAVEEIQLVRVADVGSMPTFRP